MADPRFTSPVGDAMALDSTNITGKTAIVTGGANGIGEAYVRALVASGAFVVVADLDLSAGTALEKELQRVRFVLCDTARWEDQVSLFEQAISFSPTGTISFVVANAGIHRPDDVFSYCGDGQAPAKPDLATIQVNIIGTLYTCKLAAHYFIKQNGQTASEYQQDTCLVLIGSGAAFLDCPRAPQYCASKWAMRGIMHSLRRTAFYYGSRVNVISPWYIKTSILSEEDFAHVENSGVVFAEASEAGQCLLHILSDPTINGKSLFVSGRKWSSTGFLDLGIDDYAPGSILEEIQDDQVKSAPVVLGLFV